MKPFKDFLQESSLSRLYAKYKDCDSGTISAFRGYRTYKENMALHKKLVGKLLGAGFSVTKVQGTYVENYKTPYAKEVNELSLIVFDNKKSGKLKNALMKFGKEFEQDSITYCRKRIGLCDKNKVKGENRQPFVFKEEYDSECFDLIANHDTFQNNTLRCLRMMAKETLSEDELCSI